MTEFADLTSVDRAQLAYWLNRLPFVKWDRIIPPGTGDYITAYGWIDRSEGRSDFVLLEFLHPNLAPGFTTSSARHSAAIAHILYGDTGEHNDCERIENVLAGLVPSAIRLNKAAA